MNQIILDNRSMIQMEIQTRYITESALKQCFSQNIEHDTLFRKITEKALLREVMAQVKTQTQAADILGINRATLRSRLSRYEIKLIPPATEKA